MLTMCKFQVFFPSTFGKVKTQQQYIIIQPAYLKSANRLLAVISEYWRATLSLWQLNNVFALLLLLHWTYKAHQVPFLVQLQCMCAFWCEVPFDVRAISDKKMPHSALDKPSDRLKMPPKREVHRWWSRRRLSGGV